jgi:hypothetical protein
LAAQIPPAQCIQTIRVEKNLVDLYITPGVANCFSCALDANGSVNWQVEEGGDPVPASASSDAVVNGSFLIIAMPDDYVQPGTAGRRDISCSVNGRRLEARLVSPSK